MLISELMTAELSGEMAMTRKLLARIPDDKLEWKPAGELHTIAWNAATRSSSGESIVAARCWFWRYSQ